MLSLTDIVTDPVRHGIYADCVGAGNPADHLYDEDLVASEATWETFHIGLREGQRIQAKIKNLVFPLGKASLAIGEIPIDVVVAQPLE